MKKPFYPDVLMRDAVAGALVVSALVALAVWWPASLGPVADPSNSSTNPRPEWYFLFLFELLKHVPGRWEGVAAVVLPTIAIAALLLLPFLDRRPHRHPLDRPFAAALAASAVFFVLFLSVKGAHSPLSGPVLELDPSVLSGRALFRDLRCIGCHSISGHGGVVGPELSGSMRRHDALWLQLHFRNPAAVTPGSKMPRYDLQPAEERALTSYLSAVAGLGPYSPTAVDLFRDNCLDCHSLQGVGNSTEDEDTRGPDLSDVGCLRDRDWLLRYALTPRKMLPKSRMEGFAGEISETDMDEIAKMLSAQRRSCLAP